MHGFDILSAKPCSKINEFNTRSGLQFSQPEHHFVEATEARGWCFRSIWGSASQESECCIRSMGAFFGSRGGVLAEHGVAEAMASCLRSMGVCSGGKGLLHPKHGGLLRKQGVVLPEHGVSETRGCWFLDLSVLLNKAYTLINTSNKHCQKTKTTWTVTGLSKHVNAFISYILGLSNHTTYITVELLMHLIFHLLYVLCLEVLCMIPSSPKYRVSVNLLHTVIWIKGVIHFETFKCIDVMQYVYIYIYI